MPILKSFVFAAFLTSFALGSVCAQDMTGLDGSASSYASITDQPIAPASDGGSLSRASAKPVGSPQAALKKGKNPVMKGGAKVKVSAVHASKTPAPQAKPATIKAKIQRQKDKGAVQKNKKGKR